MPTRIFAVAILAFATALPAAWAQPPRGPERDSRGSIERWTRELAQELDHLQDDLYYDRPRDAGRWEGRLEEAVQAVIHFQRSLQRGADAAHLRRDFREMDEKIHQLLERLSESSSSRIRRSGERIRYADEQLHYRLAAADPNRGESYGQVVTRHAQVLEEETRRLQQAVSYDRQRGGRGAGLEQATRAYVDEVRHFRQSAERGADRGHLQNDFASIDRSWNALVRQINRSDAGAYIRRSAQRVNEVHNQLYEVISGGDGPPWRGPQKPPAGRPKTGPQKPPAGPPEPERSRRQPQIEFEIPGIGRFQLR